MGNVNLLENRTSIIFLLLWLSEVEIHEVVTMEGILQCLLWRAIVDMAVTGAAMGCHGLPESFS